MTAHDHREHVPGCFRCDLSSDEIAAEALEWSEATLPAAVETLDRVDDYEPPELHSRNPLDAPVDVIPESPSTG